MEMYIKPLRWLADSKRRVREFPQEARQRAGFQLWEVQQGVNEIRVHVKGEYRVLYVAKFEEAVYVLHAFPKKTQRTSKQHVEVASDRYRVLLQERVRMR